MLMWSSISSLFNGDYRSKGPYALFAAFPRSAVGDGNGARAFLEGLEGPDVFTPGSDQILVLGTNKLVVCFGKYALVADYRRFPLETGGGVGAQGYGK